MWFPKGRHSSHVNFRLANTSSVELEDVYTHLTPLGKQDHHRTTPIRHSRPFIFTPPKEGPHEAQIVKQELDSNVMISMVQSKECR